MPRTQWQPVKISAVDDLVADDIWEYHKLGRKLRSRVALGRPAPDPSGQDWYTPLLFENEMKGWTAVYGVGPIDSLVNAMAFVRNKFHEYAPTPTGGKGRSPSRPTKRARPASNKTGSRSAR